MKIHIVIHSLSNPPSSPQGALKNKGFLDLKKNKNDLKIRFLINSPSPLLRRGVGVRCEFN